MSEADVYERLRKLEDEMKWVKDRLAQRFGIREGEEYDALRSIRLHDGRQAVVVPSSLGPRFDK